MRKIIGKIILILIFILSAAAIYLGLLESEAIRNYRIKNYSIDAVIDEYGDMRVIEDTIYRFNGKYNGITITIPDSVSKEYYENMTKDSINDSESLPDTLYRSSGIKNVSIYVVEGGEKRIFNQVGAASIGDMGVYEVLKENGFTTYKIYEPSKNENKKIVIEYTLEDVAVLHNDYGEIYWNFIGGANQCKISNLNINVSTKSKGIVIDKYTHGNSSGKIQESDKGEVKVKYKNVKPGEFVSVRMLFDKSAIKQASKRSGVEAVKLVANQEQSYTEKSKLRIAFNVIAIFGIVGILAYWIYLLIKYEKEMFIPSASFDDMELLEKYNPMIAACIAQNRGMHPRDIIAVLVDLLNLGVLKMEVTKVPDKYGRKDTYKYILEKNLGFFEDPKKLEALDDIQNDVLDMFFGRGINGQIELMKKLQEIKDDERAARKFKQLEEKCTEKLEEIGANFKKIPTVVLILNNMLFFITLIYIIGVVAYNITLSISTLSTSRTQMAYSMLIYSVVIIMVGLFLYPITIFIIKIILMIVNAIRATIAKIAFKLTSKKLVRAIIKIGIVFVIAMVVEKYIINESYILICTLLLFSGLLLILTDNLMTSHDNRIKKDYFRLKMLQDNIENGSLLEEKEFKHNILWERYLTFAIALGVGDVSKYVKLMSQCGDLAIAVDQLNNISENYFDMYFSESNQKSEQRIKNFSDILDSIASSRGDGGFSGGGRRWLLWRRRWRILIRRIIVFWWWRFLGRGPEVAEAEELSSVS